jgi:predicted CXXCH cytochrome family protein
MEIKIVNWFSSIGMLIFLYYSPALAQNDFVLKRLDPHGEYGIDLQSMSLAKNPKCRNCHPEKKGKVTLKTNVDELCTSCHNSYPHSGLIEHMGKDLTKLKIPGLNDKIGCLSCHRAHRSPLNKQEMQANLIQKKSASFLYKPVSRNELPFGLNERKSKEYMLKNDCLYCHQWKDLP